MPNLNKVLAKISKFPTYPIFNFLLLVALSELGECLIGMGCH